MEQRRWWVARPVSLSLSYPSNKDQFVLYFTCYFGRAVPRKDIYFTAHAKLRQVNARLNREAGVRDDLAVVLGFQVVHVGAVAMHVHADGVPRAVGEVLRVTGIVYELARCLVYFPTGNTPLAGEGFLDFLDPRIAPAGDDIEDLNLLFRWRADHAGPGNVVIDGVGRVLFGPYIQQHKIAGVDRGRSLGARLVMRIPAVRIHGDDRQVFRPQVLPAKRFRQPRLNLILGGAAV